MNTALFISLVTAMSYALTVTGAFTLVTEDGNEVYPQRWLFNALTCSFQLWSWFGTKDVSAALVVAAVIASGTAIDIGRASGVHMWPLFLVASIAFGYAIVKYWVLNRSQKLKLAFLLCWCAFPLIVIIDVFQPNLGWWLFIADVFAKIIFEVILQFTYSPTSAQRSE